MINGNIVSLLFMLFIFLLPCLINYYNNINACYHKCNIKGTKIDLCNQESLDYLPILNSFIYPIDLLYFYAIKAIFHFLLQSYVI